MNMRLVTNSVSPTQVTDNGDHFLVENVPFVKSMHLSGGYVPEFSIKETANEWDGVPATLNHPRDNNGEPVPAASKQETHIGTIEDSWFDGEFVRADIQLDKAELQSADAKAVKDALESGEQIHVSSQYVPRELPPGEYDGDHRTNVEAIAKPDSVAILPNKKGKCDIQDGCGINPELVANANVTVPMTQNAKHFDKGDLVTWPFGDGTGQGRVVEIFDEPGEVSRTIKGTEVTREVTDDEAAYLVDVWRGDEFAGQALKSGSELSEWTDAPDEAMQANQNDIPYEITNVSPDDIDAGPGFTDNEWDGSEAIAQMPNPSDDDDAPDVLDQTHVLVPADDEARDEKANWKLPFRSGPDAPVNTRALVAIDAALSGARGGVEGVDEDTLSDASEWTQAMLEEAPADLFGAQEEDDMEDNALQTAVSWLAEFVSANSNETTGAESPVDNSNEMDRDALIEDITANSKLTESALEERCNDGLKAIHDDVMAETETTDESMSDNEPDDTDDAITFESEDEFEQYVEDIVANRVEQREQESELEDLATEIVANSADYEETEEVLDDYPTKPALKAKRDSLNAGGAIPGSGVSSTGIESNSEAEDIPSGVLE